jgi:hypothetical protein
MLTQNGFHSNDNGHFLNCESDYEPAPLIDVTPQTAPKPGWRDQQAAFTHHIQWIDADGISHGLTIRSDSLQDLMADLKMVKGMIKAAKQKARESQPAKQTESELNAETDVKRCPIHGIDMPRRFSKRNNGHFFAHTLPDNTFCYGSKGHSGRERKA